MIEITRNDRFIGLDEVSRRINRKTTVIYKMMREGKFPKRYRNGWLESDVINYMQGVVNEGANDDGHEAAAA